MWNLLLDKIETWVRANTKLDGTISAYELIQTLKLLRIQ